MTTDVHKLIPGQPVPSKVSLHRLENLYRSRRTRVNPMQLSKEERRNG